MDTEDRSAEGVTPRRLWRYVVQGGAHLFVPLQQAATARHAQPAGQSELEEHVCDGQSSVGLQNPVPSTVGLQKHEELGPHGPPPGLVQGLPGFVHTLGP
jgi:hypothetical protein